MPQIGRAVQQECRDRKSGSAGMPRPISYAVFCLKKKTTMRKGIWHAIGAYFTWGLFPIYWKWLRDISAIQLIGHRIVWSCVLLIGVLLLMRQWKALQAAVGNGRALLIYALAAILIGFNWSIYVWALYFDVTVATELYTLSLHDALPISVQQEC